MNEQFISRAALGRIAHIGALYDARTDEFRLLSIFKKTIPGTALNLMDDHSSDIHLVSTESFTEKFSKLDVKPDLSVSLLAGLLPLDGSAKYLKDTKSSSRTLKSSLVYKIKVAEETLNIHHEDLHDSFSMDAIKTVNATHFVAGISWGASLVISCAFEKRDSKKVKEIEGSLTAQMKKLIWEISGKAPAQFSNGENDESVHFDVRIFGDILPKNSAFPTTTEGALQLTKELPSLVANCNGGKGKPLTYQLLPMSLLQNYLSVEVSGDIIYKSLEESSLIKVINIFEEIAAAQQEFNDFYQDITEHSYCLNGEDIAEIDSFKDTLALDEAKQRNKLSTLLTDARSGNSADKFGNFIQTYNSSPKISGTLRNVRKQLLGWKPLRDKIAFAKLLEQYGAKYIGRGLSLDEEVLADHDRKIVKLYFNQSSKSCPSRWAKNRQLFFQELQRKAEDCRYYAVDCDIHPELLPQNCSSSCVQVTQGDRIIFKDLLKAAKKRKTKFAGDDDVDFIFGKFTGPPLKRLKRDDDDDPNEAIQKFEIGTSTSEPSILQRRISDTKVENGEEDTPLHQAVFEQDEALVLQLLLEGADINATNKFYGMTPLHVAAMECDSDKEVGLKVLKHLIDNNADGFVKDCNGGTFLHTLVSKEEPPSPSQFHLIVEYLIGKVPIKIFNAPGLYGRSPFQLAVENMEVEEGTLSLLKMNGANFNAVDDCGHSVLHYALSGSRSPSFLSNLIELGADWSHIDHSRQSLLHKAAVFGDVEAVKYFLSLGADINGADLDGNSPLHLAVKSDRNILQVAAELVKGGADVKMRNRKLKTPVDLAAENRKTSDKEQVQKLLANSKDGQQRCCWI